MKHFYFLALLIWAYTTQAQEAVANVEKKTITAEDKKRIEQDSINGWKFGGLGGVTFNQAGFVNWAAGGVNAISMNFNLRFYADLKKNKHLLQNWLAAEYGLQFSKQTYPRLNKNADRWEIFSKYGYQISKKTYIGGYVDLRSQFTNTYKYAADSSRTLTSGFASPLIFEGAFGIDYVPNSYISLFFSPLASKVTFIGNNSIALTEAYGNKWPSKTKSEFGATLIAQYKQSFWKQNISINSIFRAYKNYLFASVDPYNTAIRETKSSYRKNIDIDWQTTLGFKVNKFITASIFTHLIWDHDIVIPNKDGLNAKPRLQFRDIIGIGLVYQTNYFKEKEIKALQL
jgi:hypothetical protein